MAAAAIEEIAPITPYKSPHAICAVPKSLGCLETTPDRCGHNRELAQSITEPHDSDRILSPKMHKEFHVECWCIVYG
jgi:hypothetical protein